MSSEIVIGQKLKLDRSHLVHKPIDPKNLSKKFNKDYFERPYILERKYDGCHMIVVKLAEGEVGAWSREGNPVFSMDHVLAEVDESYPVGTVLFGEAWSAVFTFEAISGTFRRQYTADDLCGRMNYMVFDRIDVDEFLAGECEKPYWFRRSQILNGCHVKKTHEVHDMRIEPDELAHLRGPGLVYGLDGYIAADHTAYWIAGAGKGGEKIKVKDHVSVDLRVSRLIEGEGKFAGTLGALELEDGTVTSAGTMTNAERELYWKSPALLLWKYVEVHALGYTTAGKLREPRFHRTRFDKE